MRCKQRGCTKDALRNSNYCSEHRPELRLVRKFVKKKVAKKKR